MAAEPSHLAFGELMGADFNQLEGLPEGADATQMLDNLAIAQGLHSGVVVGEAVLEKVLGFGDEAAAEHVLHASVYALAQVGGGAREGEGG